MATQIISEIGLAQQEKTEQSKIFFEQKLWAETKKSRSSKIAGALLMVLGDDGETIIIGVPASLRYDVCGGGNYSLQIELEELVKKLSGRRWVKFEEADSLCQERRQLFAKLAIEQAKELEINTMVQAQKDAGKCNIVPFPKEVAKEIITADATIARLGLFAVNTFKGNYREIDRTIQNPKTGEETKLQIKVGDILNGRGVLKQSHQQAFYMLLKEWSQQGYKLAETDGDYMGVIKMSMYQLVKLLRGSMSGRNVSDVRKLMEDMASIRVEVVETSADGKIIKSHGFALIYFSWKEKACGEKQAGRIAGAKSTVKILMSEYITDNFLKKQLRPMSLKAYLEIKDPGRKGTAQILFDWLEYRLSTRQSYSRRLSKFPNDFGTSAYEHKSLRKQTILPVVKQLNGRLILEGRFYMEVSLVETSDGADYKLVAKKISASN